MNNSQNLFLVDVDNTLIDVEKIKKLIQDELLKMSGGNLTPETYLKIYREVGQEKGFVDIKEIAKRLSQKLNLSDSNQILDKFINISFKEFLLPGAIKLLTLLKENGKVVIYSQGDQFYQLLKINKSGIEEVVGFDSVKISQNKIGDLENIIKSYQNEGFLNIIIIDDKVSILERAKEIDPKVKGIWICFGNHKDILPKNNENVFIKVNYPEDLYQIIKNESTHDLTVGVSSRDKKRDKKINIL